jgi:nitrogen regulatory protein PII
MKRVIAIFDNESAEPAGSALRQIGISEIVAVPVIREPAFRSGIGTRNGKIHRQSQPPSLPEDREDGREKVAGREKTDDDGYSSPEGFVPGTMILVAVPDEMVFPVIRTLTGVNQRGTGGNGEIVICPMVSILEIGNGENDGSALL